MDEEKWPCWCAPSLVIVVVCCVDAREECFDIVGGVIFFSLDYCLALHVCLVCLVLAKATVSWFVDRVCHVMFAPVPLFVAYFLGK